MSYRSDDLRWQPLTQAAITFGHSTEHGKWRVSNRMVSAILSGSLERTKHMRCYADTDSLQHQFDGRLICMLFLLNREIFIRSQHYMCRTVIG
jgi:hypothetical protein